MNINIKKYKSITKDFSLNILASFAITAVTQIVVYPLLAREYDAVLYGIILTIMGVGNAIVTTVGGSLNNTRLLMATDYERENKKGDFLPLLYSINLVSLILYLFYIKISDTNINVVTVLLLLLYVSLGNARGYGMVAYRLNLNFKNNLLCSIAIALGNILGVAIITIGHLKTSWPIIFVLGEAFGLIVLSSNTAIFREPLRCTSFFRKTLNKTSILLATTLMANVLIYLDRILLLPILGGESVSIYTTAAFFGKCLGLLLTPMAGVLLSYFSQSDYRMTRRKFREINLMVAFFAGAFFLGSLIISKWFTGILYPTLIDSAAPYLVIANLTMIIGAVGNMTQPAVLKYAPTEFQIVTQTIYCLVYIGGGYLGSMKNGLWGFSIAAIIAALTRIIMLYALGEIYINDGEGYNRQQ